MDSDSDSDISEGEEWFVRDLQKIKNNDPRFTILNWRGNNAPGPLGRYDYDVIQDITNEEWEEIGRDISNNTHLKQLQLCNDVLNNDEKMSCLFRGLTTSSSIEYLTLVRNGLSVAGVRSMFPFLQIANNLRCLDISANNTIRSEGFNVLLTALRDSPISLSCVSCGIESIQIDTDHFPRRLTHLFLGDNNINADGCREIAKLLQTGDSTLTHLFLDDNKIDDEGVAILVDALQGNTSLKSLQLQMNDGITKEGLVMLQKLVNDISSVKATLQSHHTLRDICVMDEYSANDEDIRIQQLINTATNVNKNCIGNSQAAGREKVIGTQLFSIRRAELAQLQRVKPRSVFSEINPLHLPEVLSLVGLRHGQGELYVALKSSIADLLSTVNKRRCIKQRLADLAAESEKLHAELAELDAAGDATHVGNEVRSKKRRRKWWWGIWGSA